MALLWADFPQNDPGLYNTTTSLVDDGIFAQVNGTMIADPDPTAPLGTVIRLDNSQANPGLLRYVMPSTQDRAGCAVRFYLSKIPTADDIDNPAIIQFRTVDNVTRFSLIITAGARMRLVAGYYNGAVLAATIAESAGPVAIANAWQQVEVWSTKGGAGTGSIEVRLEGVPIIEADGLTLAGTGGWAQIAHMYAGSNFAGGNFCLKTVIYMDGTGSQVNDFIGTCGVYDRVLTSDIAFTGWNTSSGTTGFNLIDESPANDTDYIQAPFPLPAPAVFGLSGIPDDITSIKGIIPVVRMAKTDGGDAQVQVSLVDSGAGIDSPGADRTITTAQVYWYDVHMVNPLTAAPWLPSVAGTLDLEIARTV